MRQRSHPATAGLFLLVLAILVPYTLSAKCLDAATVQDIQKQMILPEKAVMPLQNTAVMPPGSSDLCDETSKTYLLFEALSIIRTAKFSEKRAFNEFDHGFFKTEFWSYFSQRITKIQDEENNPGCDQVVAFVLGGAHDSVMHTCPLFYEASTSVAQRVAVMLHEPRHFDGSEFSHVLCTRKGSEGYGVACDESIQGQGTWAITIETLNLLINQGLLTKNEDLNNAKNLILEIADENYNQEVFPASQMNGVYLVEKTGGTAWILNAGKLFPAPLIDHGKLISRHYSLSAYPEDRSDSYTAGLFSNRLAKLAARGSVALDYNLQPKSLRTAVVDVLNSDYISSSITAHTIEIARQASIKTSFSITAAFLGPEAGDLHNDSIYVLDEKNEMHQVQTSVDGKTLIKEVPNFADGYLAVVIYDQQRLALNKDGVVVILPLKENLSPNATPQIYVPLKDHRFQSMTRPFLWKESLFAK